MLILKKPHFKTLFLLLLIAALLAITGCGNQETASEKAAAEKANYQHAVVSHADQAQQLLVDGNKRYISGAVLNDDLSSQKRQDLVSKGQKPFALILTCSDSRVPPELIFDQGLGDLFVVRVAGNVADPITLGSIEYGAEHLNAPLLVVMGHDKCGAVKATVDGGEVPPNIGAIEEKIKPSVIKAKSAGATGDALYEKSEDENVITTIAEIENSPVIKHLVESGKLKIIGAKYKQASGEVVFISSK